MTTEEEGCNSDSDEEEEDNDRSTDRLSSPTQQITINHLSISYPNPDKVGNSHGRIAKCSSLSSPLRSST